MRLFAKLPVIVALLMLAVPIAVGAQPVEKAVSQSRPR
jgi:hypothetical protein